MADLLGVEGAVKEIEAKALPEVIAAFNAAMDRLERLFERLDGATITIRLSEGKSA